MLSFDRSAARGFVCCLYIERIGIVGCLAEVGGPVFFVQLVCGAAISGNPRPLVLCRVSWVFVTLSVPMQSASQSESAVGGSGSGSQEQNNRVSVFQRLNYASVVGKPSLGGLEFYPLDDRKSNVVAIQIELAKEHELDTVQLMCDADPHNQLLHEDLCHLRLAYVNACHDEEVAIR
ncbi:hypothetical protein L6452_36339 [Arctium lappa]|uniref:Uncharacterized protein n=1 Tax=Arctium lappa TaxID=4217 RepID=A0ACB8Y8V8_ARCLA|nr:hypothetical protein L6452_36339 [Arctium lappa]